MFHQGWNMKGNTKSMHRVIVPADLILAFFVIATLLWVVVPPATAHAPSDMSISYNELSKNLSVSITHQVQNPLVHYIQEVRVTINGNVVSDSRYTSQPVPDTFTYTFPVLTVPGDTIEVTASCNMGGSASRIMYMPGPTATAPGQPGTPQPTQSAAWGIVPVLGALLAIEAIRRK
jgi:hypothetical protein